MEKLWRLTLMGCLICVCGSGSATLLAPPGATLRFEGAASAAEIRYHAGLEALAANDLGAAAAAFRESRELDRSWALPLLGLAEVSQRQDNRQQTEGLLREALLMAPRDVHVRTAWGRYLMSRGAYLEAETAFLQATQLAPQTMEPRLELGALYANALQRPNDAVTAFESAIKIAPEHAGARHGLGMALISAGDPDRGLASLHVAAKLAPDNPLPWHAQGRVYASRGDFDRALAAYTEALRIEPKFTISRVDRGNIYLRRGLWLQARDDFAAVTKSSPANVSAQVGLGVAAQQTGDSKTAREAYLAAVAAQPTAAIAFNNLAWLDAKQSDSLEQAQQWAGEAVRLSPTNADFRDTLGWILYLRGDYQGARNALEEAVAIQPKPHILYHLGRVYMELGAQDEARAALSRAVASGTDFKEAAEARALLQQVN